MDLKNVHTILYVLEALCLLAILGILISARRRRIREKRQQLRNEEKS